MAGVRLDPYLFFDGNCREAMDHYKGIFGGELTVQTYGEIPGDYPSEQRDKVIHARLEGLVTIMASDGGPEEQGNGRISLSIGGHDEATLRQIFDDLSKDGKVSSPLKQEFWGDTFGSLTDKYGINWMINIEAKKGN